MPQTEVIIKPSCQDCASSTTRQFTDEYFDKVPRLLSPAQLHDFHLSGDADTHRAVEILAHYKFEGAPVRCSFPEHAPHGNGCIILTACRKHTANIGRICGRKTIDNYAYLEAGLKRAVERDGQRKALRFAPQVELAKIQEWREEMKRFGRFHDVLRARLPKIFETLKKYPPGAAVVQVPTWRRNPEGRKVEIVVQQRLAGTAIGDERFGKNTLESAKKELEAVAAEVVVDQQLQKPYHLHRRLVAARTKVKDVVALCKDARAFFSTKNMTLLLLAAELGGARVHHIQVVEAEFRFWADGAERALGANGYRIVTNRTTGAGSAVAPEGLSGRARRDPPPTTHANPKKQASRRSK
jgi:hypothetical protein